MYALDGFFGGRDGKPEKPKSSWNIIKGRKHYGPAKYYNIEGQRDALLRTDKLAPRDAEPSRAVPLVPPQQAPLRNAARW